MKQLRRPTMGFYFSPRAKTFHIVVNMKDVPGALNSVLSALRSKVDLVESISYALEDGTAAWSGFGKALSKSDTEESIQKAVSRSPSVLECLVEGSDRGLLVDSFHQGVEVAPGRPAIILPVTGFSRICEHLAKILGTGGETILFEEGSALGRATGHYLAGKLGPARPDLRTKAALGLYRANGWGTVTLKEDPNGKLMKIKVKDCPECAGNGGDRKECGFMRGHLVSIVTELSEVKYRSEETRCRLRGDPDCEFSLTSQFPAQTGRSSRAANAGVAR